MLRKGTTTTITAIVMAISMLVVLSAPMVAAQDSYVFVDKMGDLWYWGW
jgi:archaellum component FlaF (FlaF/FlaG flagellin family)